MNNLNYDGWQYWVNKTYKGKPLKSVFIKLLDAWGDERKIAIEALEKIGSPTYQGKHPMEIAQEALRQING